MTAIDFFYSLSFFSLVDLVINFVVLGVAVHIGARTLGIKSHYVKAFGVSFFVTLFSLIRLLVPVDKFFWLLFLAIVGFIAISREYRVNPTQASFVLLVSAIVFIVLDSLFVPVIIAAAS